MGRREKLAATDLMKDREESKAAAIAKAMAGPKMSETEEFKEAQAKYAAAMDTDGGGGRSRTRSGKDAMEVDPAPTRKALKAKGGVAKKRVKQGSENYEKLKKVGIRAGVSPIAFARLHKQHKKGRKPGIREQLGIE
mmetsp:Transcript_46125/g.116775  ORF Transcript_46125/g.116775 Transcript_46125/m.116775 type:complete len:137 (-) Transcript_46125:70-480(-)